MSLHSWLFFLQEDTEQLELGRKLFMAFYLTLKCWSNSRLWKRDVLILKWFSCRFMRGSLLLVSLVIWTGRWKQSTRLNINALSLCHVSCNFRSSSFKPILSMKLFYVLCVKRAEKRFSCHSLFIGSGVYVYCTYINVLIMISMLLSKYQQRLWETGSGFIKTSMYGTVLYKCSFCFVTCNPCFS